MSKAIVREAFDTSVTCTRPPVSFQTSQVSIVPQSSSPRAARACAPGTRSRIQRTFVAEKYASMTRPVRSRTSVSSPRARSSSQMPALARLCHTTAGWIGRPVARSHTTVVSRWLVMPIAVTSRAPMPAAAIALRPTATVVAKISSGSCSTCPDAG